MTDRELLQEWVDWYEEYIHFGLADTPRVQWLYQDTVAQINEPKSVPDSEFRSFIQRIKAIRSERHCSLKRAKEIADEERGNSKP